VDRTSLIQKIFSANSAGVARRGDQKATPKQSVHPKRQKPLGFNVRDQRALPIHATRARRGRTQGERVRARFRLSLAASLRRTALLIPFRRPPAAFPLPTPDRSNWSIPCVANHGSWVCPQI